MPSILTKQLSKELRKRGIRVIPEQWYNVRDNFESYVYHSYQGYMNPDEILPDIREIADNYVKELVSDKPEWFNIV